MTALALLLVAGLAGQYDLYGLHSEAVDLSGSEGAVIQLDATYLAGPGTFRFCDESQVQNRFAQFIISTPQIASSDPTVAYINLEEGHHTVTTTFENWGDPPDLSSLRIFYAFIAESGYIDCTVSISDTWLYIEEITITVRPVPNEATSFSQIKRLFGGR